MKFISVLCFLFFVSLCISRAQSESPALGLGLENYEYPYPVSYIHLQLQGQDAIMAYMDLKPVSNAIDQTVILLHGKNFFGAYWENTISYLHQHGYRVIVPDQLGFGKSTKSKIVYSFQMMAENTKQLMTQLSIPDAVIIGHSMGGMLATRFALMYPELTKSLVLENPIGLEDYKVKVPYVSIDEEYQNELHKTEQTIRDYHKTYYVNWRPEYEKYVQVQYQWTRSSEYARLAIVNALTSQMIYTQPVIYELSNLSIPTLLIIGLEDRTAIGKDRVSDEVKNTMGNYPALGKVAAKQIRNSTLIEIPNTGHTPHLETPDAFHSALIQFLQKQKK